eukprot:TRINITY_DN2239_c0_g1_i1.p1 TRINITY_DN2239_c0_g1~~TRINITY_DN2239_c0_g1_i1.p1  ORF type:complete len:448 (+),score=119.29 TRINITY_DN2239_c0_g1_i1:53-1396(+)
MDAEKKQIEQIFCVCDSEKNLINSIIPKRYLDQIQIYLNNQNLEIPKKDIDGEEFKLTVELLPLSKEVGLFLLNTLFVVAKNLPLSKRDQDFPQLCEINSSQQINALSLDSIRQRCSIQIQFKPKKKISAIINWLNKKWKFDEIIKMVSQMDCKPLSEILNVALCFQMGGMSWDKEDNIRFGDIWKLANCKSTIRMYYFWDCDFVDQGRAFEFSIDGKAKNKPKEKVKPKPVVKSGLLNSNSSKRIKSKKSLSSLKQNLEKSQNKDAKSPKSEEVENMREHSDEQIQSVHAQQFCSDGNLPFSSMILPDQSIMAFPSSPPTPIDTPLKKEPSIVQEQFFSPDTPAIDSLTREVEENPQESFNSSHVDFGANSNTASLALFSSTNSMDQFVIDEWCITDSLMSPRNSPNSPEPYNETIDPFNSMMGSESDKFVIGGSEEHSFISVQFL